MQQGFTLDSFTEDHRDYLERVRRFREASAGEVGRSPDSTVRPARFFLRSWQNKVSLHCARRKRCSCPS